MHQTRARRRWLWGTTLAIGLALSALPQAVQVERLVSVGGLPPHLVGRFREPAAFLQRASGDYLVFDRSAHTVYRVDPRHREATLVVDIGTEAGRLLNPSAFAPAPDGGFAVADAPRGAERIQGFDAAGARLWGFTLPGRLGARVTAGSTVLNGVASLRVMPDRVVVSEPESGALITEYSTSGAGFRSIGRLRTTGFERDRDLHAALNAGLPLVDPAGGYFFVFLAGTPVFRKYDATGALLFERRIQGAAVDAYVATLPTTWPRRKLADRELPLVSSTVRAAAVDAAGRLWVSLAVPFTYVYDAEGDRVRVVQFQAAGVIVPTSLSFTASGRLLVTPGCYEFQP